MLVPQNEFLYCFVFLDYQWLFSDRSPHNFVIHTVPYQRTPNNQQTILRFIGTYAKMHTKKRLTPCNMYSTLGRSKIAYAVRREIELPTQSI